MKGREPGRRWKVGPAEAHVCNFAQEPGELDRDGSPEIGVTGLGTVNHGHGLRGAAGASRDLRAAGC